MSRKNEMARNLLTQEPGRVESHAVAADTQTIAQRKPARHNGGIAFLMRAHGLNEVQAHALAVLIWGASQ
jgi:hypothetical protein